MSKSKGSSSYLGVFVAERLLGSVFNHVERMPYGHAGWDFICGKGKRIDVKSSTLHKSSRGLPKHEWKFTVRRNEKADSFLCIAFDDRESLTPMHIWLIPARMINHLKTLSISNTEYCLSKWKQFEKSTQEATARCEDLRTIDHGEDSMAWG
jgi:hypothetical protein